VKIFLKNSEVGFSLIMAVSVVALLMMLGLVVMQSVNSDVRVAGNSRNTQNMIQLAEAGIAQGLDVLRASPYNIDDQSTPSTQTSVINSAIGSGSSLSVVGSSDTELGNCVEKGWRQLVGSDTWTAYGNGFIRVMMYDNIESDNDRTTDTDQTFLVRALASDGYDGRRCIEIEVKVD
jgi:Tfp pilus assembly protein PilX